MLLAPEQPVPAPCVRQVQLTGMHLVQRFDSPSASSSAIVTSAVVLLPASGLQFREHSWIRITASPSSHCGAVVEKCYRVYPGEHRGHADVAGRPDANTQEAEFVLQTLASNTRLGMQAAQNTLLSGKVFR